jgi:hypothetical protein
VGARVRAQRAVRGALQVVGSDADLRELNDAFEAEIEAGAGIGSETVRHREGRHDARLQLQGVNPEVWSQPHGVIAQACRTARARARCSPGVPASCPSNGSSLPAPRFPACLVPPACQAIPAWSPDDPTSSLDASWRRPVTSTRLLTFSLRSVVPDAFSLTFMSAIPRGPWCAGRAGRAGAVGSGRRRAGSHLNVRQDEIRVGAGRLCAGCARCPRCARCRSPRHPRA